MPRRPINQDIPLQMARLRSQMHQADAQWEEITRSIQRHQEHLAALRQRLAHLYLALTLPGEQPARPTPALEMQVAALNQQKVQLEQQLALENARRSAVTRQFEQARLDLASLRRPRQRQGQSIGRKLLNWCFKNPWRLFWSALQQSCEWSEVIPSDLSLRDHAWRDQSP